jgi:outer membrane protein TolC
MKNNTLVQICFFAMFSLSTLQVYGSEKAFKISLLEAENKAVSRSLDLKSYEQVIESIKAKGDSIRSKNLPQLNIEGSYRYLSEVPEIDMGSKQIQFGDNKNYSIGPSLTYSLFDGNFVKRSYEGIKALKKSKESEKLFIKKAVLLGVRLAYLNTLIKLEELKLNMNSLKLAKSQNKDIKQKKKYGASGNIDLAISNRNVYSHELKVFQKKNEFQHAFFTLITLTGDINLWDRDVSPLPFSSFSNGRLVLLDSLVQINRNIKSSHLIKPNANNPQLKSLQLLARSHRLNAQSEQSRRWPKVLLKLKSSYDYPNGPELESIHQNSLLVSLTMPIWDGGDISARKGAENALAASYDSKAKKIKDELTRDWDKWSTELRNLKEIKVIAKKLRVEAQKVALINLKAYRAGEIKFTEVERSNLRELEAGMNEVLVQSRNFAALAHLQAISGWGLE